MNSRLADLVQLLELERLEDDLFRGESCDIGRDQVFGGQVLGQALRAAYATTEGRAVHSLHAYFLRRGDVNAPIVYEVDRSRDGHSFSSRRVIAIQHGEQIFHMAASFQVPTDGLDHQFPMPQVPPPEQLQGPFHMTDAQRAQLSPAAQRFLNTEIPFEFAAVDPMDPFHPTPREARQSVWFRAAGRLPDDPLLHRCLLAYASDYHLVATALRPHGLSFVSPGVIMASIDHAMWFHRPARADEWLLYSMESPSTSGSRGFARADIYTRDGVLVASTAQEGLVRVVPPKG